jgi:hypothetical protein
MSARTEGIFLISRVADASTDSEISQTSHSETFAENTGPFHVASSRVLMKPTYISLLIWRTVEQQSISKMLGLNRGFGAEFDWMCSTA